MLWQSLALERIRRRTTDTTIWTALKRDSLPQLDALDWRWKGYVKDNGHYDLDEEQ